MNGSELQQILYYVLKMQIQFGVYRFGERLPTMEEACGIFRVSVKPIRAAYQRLQKENYITISKSVGVKVAVKYSQQDIEGHIQAFFSCRRAALIDLSRSIGPLFNEAQWLGLKTASPQVLERIERLARQEGVLPHYRMIQHLRLIYGSLRNNMLMRLVWQVVAFYHAPFLSMADSVENLDVRQNALLQMTGYCHKKAWKELFGAVEEYQTRFSNALCQFYENRIPAPPPEHQHVFYWSSYQKASQRCYTLAMELLIRISRGRYEAGSFLPSLEKLAKEKQVSLSTMRRALSVLNSIGAVKSINGVGTQILSLGECAQNCNFTLPVVQKRLLDFAQSLQILTLSCEQTARVTLDEIEPAGLEELKQRLCLLKKIGREELAVYGVLEVVTHHAPFQAMRKIYSELFHQLLWGYPLRGIPKEPERLQSWYRPGLECLLQHLERPAPQAFAAKLKELMLYELDSAVGLLVKVNIQEAAALSLSQGEDGAKKTPLI